MLKINVISYSPIRDSSALDSLLSKLELDYQLCDREEFSNLQCDDGGNDVNLIFIDAKEISDSERLEGIRSCLARQKQAINLCLLPALPKEGMADLCSMFHDFISWPCDHLELRARINKFQHHYAHAPEVENQLLIDQFAAMNLTGQSPAFIQLLNLIKKVSQCQATVLIEGETGTGKENAARAMHYLGPRREHGFVPVNCAAIPDELFESELFGHARGAFTDAKLAQKGLVEIAHGGTLFLDEVDSLSPKAQAALLRFLQTQEYRPLGAKQTRQANVRILAATNANLLEKSRNKEFREDLYFRLNVLRVFMPALRDRKADIPLIADSLLAKFSNQHQVTPKVLSPDYLTLLKHRDWPGNIRELENVLLRDFLLAESPVITTDGKYAGELHEATDEKTSAKSVTLSFQEAKSRAIQDFERTYLERVIRLAQGNVSTAARIAGKERRSLGKLLQKYNINRYKYSPYGSN
jgi:DNA-binding NtrC family response regulator